MNNLITSLAKNTLFSHLNKMQHGTLIISEEKDRYIFGHDKNIIANILAQIPVISNSGLLLPLVGAGT